MDKKCYVNQLLSPVVSASFPDVERLRYRREGSQEFAYIIFVDGSHKPVCVTEKDNQQIMWDVQSVLRYGATGARR